MLELDHLAVAARTLDEGRAYVERALGLRVQPGGRHGRYGTHNLLAGLEDGLYLEVIAIDPQAVRPRDPRWFRLDEFSGAPCLHNWICRTGDMAAHLSKVFTDTRVAFIPAQQPKMTARFNIDGQVRWL
ncbi:VOC family protein [Thalassobius sp. S69A]|uniref:VOC family protein n=1 Tax=unclassified Thalassovita TaxID=2619711 RepID=UPI000C43864F|nr:hypothetical protein [Paracoccaceae bacterium]